MELQSWLLYHLVAVTDCNQGSEDSPFIVYVCLSLPGPLFTHNQIAASLFNLSSHYHDPDETVVYRCLMVSSLYEVCEQKHTHTETL
ncbi:hypothetical protein ALC62_15797 [Cyphomyrmex costatus]|uniref:Uncharacterized protein n=1 Tax=Cyphomyrmex costatus TaxID=456900 RepID=A0A195BXQ6_9HYME|nr:hypothetical protein ALC62_15797 [Cyphomyrmex costatus]